jgi:glycosyltransferase involved in cell wall biosynthesis
VEDGAPAERTLNIPNGIDLPRMEKVRAARGTEIPQTACLIGRVVPIKDVKTFLRAMRTLVNEIPDAKGWIAGPEDEDKEYAAECRSLVTSLGLEKNVEFLGFQKIDELLPKVGVIVLSSISEALPLVLLEGFAAGVPAVSTDVGSCRQLIEGLDEEDRAFGKAGSVVGIADPEALGKAVATLLSDSQAWHDAQQAGIRRVETLYTQQQMFGSYRELYQGLLEGDI